MYLKVYKVKLLMLLMFFPFLLLAQTPPAGWEYTNTPNSHTIAIPLSANPLFNSVALPAGSWIGAFYMDGAVEKCGGAVQWNGTGNVALVAFGDDETTTPALKEGFDEGELITWKVYINSLNAAFAATVTFDATLPNSDGLFHAFGMSALTSLTSTGYVTQCIPLSGVKFASSYIQDLDPNFRNICNEILPNLNQAKNSTGATLRKVGPNWVNGIGNWVVTEGYWFKMNTAGELCLTGTKVNPQTPIALSGVRFVAYLHDFQMNAVTAFATILPNLNQAKNSTGQTLRKVGPNWVNGIGNLKPGEGYWVKMNTAGTLIYPAADNSSKASVLGTNLSAPKDDPVHFPVICGDPAENTWSVYVRSATIGGVTMEPGDEIAVYDGATCVGSKVLTVVPSPDTQFETELVVWSTFCFSAGYTAGNPVTFKLWDASTNTESVICDVVYNNEYGDAWSVPFFPSECCQYSMVDVNCTGPEPQCEVPPTANAGDDASVCAGETFTLLEASATGETFVWSSSGDGEFGNPGLVNTVYTPGQNDIAAGSVTLTLTASAPNCDDAVDAMVLTIDPLPEVPVCPPDLTDVCVNAATFEYGGYTIDPAVLGVGTHDFTITNSNNCGVESCTFHVTVIDLPEVPVCPPDMTDVCVNAEAFEYGGYTIDPAVLGVGTHDFTITNSNQCGSESCTFYVTVIGLPEVPVCPPDMTDVCVNAEVFEYGGYTIDPAVLGVGTHPFTITNSNQCGSESCTFYVTVIGLPEVPVCPPDMTDVCVNAEAFEYGGYTIEPAVLGVGTHDFTITNSNQCGSESCTFYVTVIGLPEVPVCPPDLTEVCINDAAFEYGGYFIDPAVLGTGTFEYTITNSNQCASYSCSFFVTVIGLPEPPVCPPDMDVCINADPFVYGGQYIEPALLGVGTHVFEMTSSNPCGVETCTFNITVIGLPEVPVCPPDLEVFINAEPFEYGGYTIDPSSLGLGAHTFTITNSNQCGSESCDFIITVVPVLGPAPVLTSAIGGEYSVALTWTAIDNYPKLVHFPDVIGDPAENTWSIYINSAVLNGLSLVAGDEIAIFDGDKIVGSKILTVTPTPETVFDTELVAFSTLFAGPGYVAGNPVTMKVWQAAINKESEICNFTYQDPYNEAWIQPVFPSECCLYSIMDLACTYQPDYTPTFNIYEETLGLIAAGVEGNEYVVDGLDCATEYCFYVTQILMEQQESDPSNVLCATTADCPDIDIDWANLQWPPEGTICENGAGLTVYAQVYIDNGILAENGYEGLDVWIAVGTEDTDPATWDMWYPATFAGISGYTGNPEYSAVIGEDLPLGTYYYASKFLYNDVHYFGGFSGGFWDGINNVSGVLTVEDCQPTCVPEWVNVQWPPNGTIYVGDDYTVYAQVYIPNVSGQGPVEGLEVAIGFSTEDVNPADFTNWVPAFFNVNAGNNSEYLANIGPSITEPGTYYYASRFICENAVVYGGLGGFWDNNSGVLEVLPLVCEVTCPADFAVCINDEPWEIWGVSPEGGVFSGEGVVDGTMYDPALAGVGEHLITYEYTCPNGVTGTCEFTITVNPLPDAPVCPDDLTDVCINAEAFEYGGYTIDPAVLGVGTHPFVITNINECGSVSCTFYVTVVALPELIEVALEITENATDWLPVDGTIADGYSICLDPASMGYALNIADLDASSELAVGYNGFYVDTYPAGYFEYWDNREVNEDAVVGTWQEWMWQIINGNQPIFYIGFDGTDYMLVDGLKKDFSGQITYLALPNDYPVGDYTFNGYVTSANGCMSELITVGMEFKTLPVIECPDDISVCINAEPLVFGDVVFDPAVYGVGEWPVTLTATNECGSVSCTFYVTVIGLPEVPVCPPDLAVCLNEEAFEYGGYTIDPSALGVGTHEFTITNSNQCGSESCTFVITVNDLPTYTYDLSATEICYGTEVTYYEYFTGVAPWTVEFYWNGELMTFTTSENPSITSEVLYETAVYEPISVTDGNGCVSQVSQPSTITVIPLPEVPVCPPDITVCIYDQPFEYGGYNIEPAVLGVGTHEFTITNSNQCGSESCTFYVTVETSSQTVSLPAGWSGFSYNLEPVDCAVDMIFAAPVSENKLGRIVTTYGTYIPAGQPGGSVNSIGCITNRPVDPTMPGGAKVLMNGAYDVVVDGCPLPSQVVMLRQGTNFMPVYSFDPVSTTGLFPPQVSYVLEIGGIKVWYKSGVKTLQWLMPGKAYTVVTTGACQFEYPATDNTNMKITEPPAINLTSWNDVKMSQSQHFVSIEGSALSNLQIGDVIGVFNANGHNVGMVEITDYNVSGVSVFMDDISTVEVDGMTEGEMMNFKVFRPSTREEFVAEATYDVSLPNTNLFSEYGLSSVINFTLNITGINDIIASEISVYPNPASTLVNVISGVEIRNVKLVNFVGQVVLEQNVDANSVRLDVSNLTTGIYFVKVETTSGAVVTKRITVN